ncbi:aquaporin-like protein [Lipomyces japonicus]|uniref:aquaporin-like protein n=1 Tax=Lipomyces japonicus TaxID=56871 RepID=UPI0034CE171E
MASPILPSNFSDSEGIPARQSAPSTHLSIGNAPTVTDGNEKPLSALTAVPKAATRRILGLSDTVRNELVAMIGEFVGTYLFLFFAYATAQAANADTVSSNPSQLTMIALGFGFSLAANVWTFFRVSGGLFNPAVSLSLALIGAITPLRAALLSVSQTLAGICAAAAVSALTPGPILFANALGPGVSKTRGLFIEMFLTAQLCITILMLAAERHRARHMAPLPIGFALFIGHLVGVYFTGAGINPARSFGPCVAIPSFPVYHWIYWVGPGLGAFLAAGLYRTLKFLQYETANPGQDDDGFYLGLLAHLDQQRAFQQPPVPSKQEV